nr:hypothetical protein BaRGS_020757 [Batillaria attramentaria]
MITGSKGAADGENLQTASCALAGTRDTVPVPRKRGVFTIGDYGTSDGYASMNLMKRVIGHLRDKHGEELAIQVVYEDQEKNDFNSLFNRLSGESSYTLQYKNVFPMATNINFYQQCVPDGTCDVIYSSAALHWLRDPSIFTAGR